MRPEAGRRGFLTRLTLWAVGLSAVGFLSEGCASRPKWSLVPPRPVSWTMKPLTSAATSETVLPDGRVELRIQHDLLRGVTPAMLVWWWRHLDGDFPLGGKAYPRYLIWHPVDHIFLEVVKRLPDGSLGVGAEFHMVEAFGADLRHLIDVVMHIRQLDETGAAAEVRVAGRAAMRFVGTFIPTHGGTQFNTQATLGFPGWIGRSGLNWLVRERYFPAERRRAWLKHNVEEIGNLEFFLPDLYTRYVKEGSRT